jgi:hypothetical protein
LYRSPPIVKGKRRKKLILIAIAGDIYGNRTTEARDMKDEIILQGRIYESKKLIRRRFGVGDTAMYRWAKKGILPKPVRVGNQCYYDVLELEDRLVKQEHE